MYFMVICIIDSNKLLKSLTLMIDSKQRFVVNPVKLNSSGCLLNCTMMGWALDSMTILT